jgi:subtilisin-like proprotein convertase family protein
MNSKTRVAVFATLAALGSLALCAQAFGAKTITKTYTKGVGGEQGGVPITIPDGAGPNTQLVRSPISVKKLNPRGNIKDVEVSVRASHPQARDLEFYLASPRGVINLSSDNGGAGENYGVGAESCQGTFTVFDSDVPTLISTPGIAAPFAGSFAPEESLNVLDKLGGKKATNATWSLLVEDDDSSGPTGTLFCWQLKIKQTNPKK